MRTLGQVLVGARGWVPASPHLRSTLLWKTRSLVTLSQRGPHHLSQLLVPSFCLDSHPIPPDSPDRGWPQPLAMDAASCLARRDLSHTVGQTHPSGGDSCTSSLSVNPGVKPSVWLSMKPESHGRLHRIGPTAGEWPILPVCHAILCFSSG